MCPWVPGLWQVFRHRPVFWGVSFRKCYSAITPKHQTTSSNNEDKYSRLTHNVGRII